MRMLRFIATNCPSIVLNNSTVSARSSHFGLNIAQFALTYKHTWVRSRLAFHYGDMTLSSWDPILNMVQETNAGVHLSKGFWLDAGLFTTHIGTELFMPKDNLLSSLALVTYNAAILIKDSDSREKLCKEVMELIKDVEKCYKLSENIAKLALPDSAKVIANEVINLIKL